MKLYGYPGAPTTWKVRAVAAHLGIPLEFQLVDFAKNEQQAPDYLALNPNGRTPTLVDGDFVLWESEAIMQYLAGLKPNTLWPDDKRIRADIMRWVSWQQCHWREGTQPMLFERLVKKVFNLGPADEVILARATEIFHRYATVLDGHLARQRHLVGEDVTLADFGMAMPLFYAEQGEIPLAPYLHIRDWFGRVSALPAWREVGPTQVPAAA